MLNALKESAKNSLNPNSYAYNLLRWMYGSIAGKPRVRYLGKRALTMLVRKDSRFEESELCMAGGCPMKVLDAVIGKWKPHSFLDIGCGTGKTLEYVAAKGIECVGLEGSQPAIESSPVKGLIVRADLNKPVRLERTFDLVWSYEVAEHIHPKFVEIFLETLTGHGDLIAISAARPGQGGAGHFNEQPPQYWIDRIERRGFTYQREFTEYLHGLNDGWSHNMMVFVRPR